MDQEDDRGHDTLFCPVGWISDELDHWQLRFSGPPKRPDAQPDDYPFFWSGMEYTDPESRKKNAAFEVVLPVALDPEMPHWSPKETGVLKKSNRTREAPSVRERRVSPAYSGSTIVLAGQFPRVPRIADGHRFDDHLCLSPRN
jgi:hypothetical protein